MPEFTVFTKITVEAKSQKEAISTCDQMGVDYYKHVIDSKIVTFEFVKAEEVKK